MMSANPEPPAPRQVIPRPAAFRIGGASSWAGCPVADRIGIRLQRVRAAVEGRGKGPALGGGPDGTTGGRAGATGAGDIAAEASSRAMAALARALIEHADDAGRAAVLVPLFEEDGETRVVLTVRSHALRSHRDEVAFPGGRLDPGEGPVDAALREAWEEVGLEPTLATVIGTLTPMPTVSSNTLMTPVVAVLDERPALVANPSEVERMFDVSLADLAADGVFREEWWSVPGRTDMEFPVWFFDVDGEIIWGATARILVELLGLVAGSGDPLAW